MSSVVHVYSDNTYFHNSINILIESLCYLNDTACSGTVVIIDIENIADVKKIVWPEPVCHIIFVISREAHKTFLSSFEWNVSVSYIDCKCNPLEFVGEIKLVVSNLKRRVTCKAFNNVLTNRSLSERELEMVKDFMQGKTIYKISKQLNLKYKTVANYRTDILARSFARLDIKSVRVFNVSQNLCRSYIKQNSLRFDVSHLYTCPAQ